MMRQYRIAMGLVCSGLGLIVALPAMAQQVVLTPGGTMIQPMPQAPVAATFFPGSITIDGSELKEPAPYVFVPAPGTGIDGNVRLEPGNNLTEITGPSIPIDPDVLIGGVRYGDLIKNDSKPSPYTPEALAEMVRRGEIVYTTSSPASSSTSTQPASSVTTGSVQTASDGSSNRSKALSPLLLPGALQSSDSPLSRSRILPGFNQ